MAGNMAQIVELTHPDNVELVRGAVQNWSDLDDPAGSTAVLRAAVAERLAGAGSVLVVGPHDPGLLAEVADAARELTVVVRSIVDAAAIGQAHPGARVLCGQATDALGRLGAFDLVIALDDVTRAQSLEGPAEPWAALAASVVGAVAPGGALLFAVENDLGLHRLTAAESPYERNRDADWTPLATWDATRPRTRGQLEAFLAGAGAPASAGVLEAFASFRRPGVLATAADAAAPGLEHLLPALASWTPAVPQGASPVFLTRSLALAGRLREACAGWLVATGAPAGPRLLSAAASGEPLAWTASGEAVRRSGAGGAASFEVPGGAATLLEQVVTAATDADLPRLREVLGGWRATLAAHAADGVLPPEWSDPRLANALAGPGGWLPLAPGESPATFEVAAWTALGDLDRTLRAQGVRTPWPSNLHRATVLETMGAMAGLEVPADVSPYVRPLALDARYALSRQQLIAEVRRLEEALSGAWARYSWDEKRYAVDRALRAGRKAAQKASLEAGKVAARVRGRVRRPEPGADEPRP